MDFIGLELEATSPLMLSVPEFEPLELVWRKGPVEEPLKRSPLSSQLDVQLLPPTEEEVLIGEDEIAWLHFPIDMTDTRTDLNRQTGGSSSTSGMSVLLGKDAELDCQVLQPVLQGNDKKSVCQVGPTDIKVAHTEKAGTSGPGCVKSDNGSRRCFEGHKELTKQDILIESKFSTINTDEKRKDALPRSMSSRKSRITKNHNISERRRRSRINEKMKTLQELIPRSAKLDKASILDATISYVKFLQKQVKIISMGPSMTATMLPTGPPYIQSLPSMGIGMGMNPDITVSMNIAAMGIRPGMPPFGPGIPYPPNNQPIQAPIMQMAHQHMVAHQHMMAEMFPYSHTGNSYHVPHPVPGVLFHQNGTANKKIKKRQQVVSSTGSSE